MREIKFRAWVEESKKMHDDVWFDCLEVEWFDQEAQDEDGNPGCSVLVGDRERGGLLPYAEIMQFTGLHDKNGKEIYEGDIVYLAGYGDYEVGWPFIQLYQSAWEKDIGIIIGNIYENPELLEKK